jgi:hypothetical protein
VGINGQEMLSGIDQAMFITGYDYIGLNLYTYTNVCNWLKANTTNAVWTFQADLDGDRIYAS